MSRATLPQMAKRLNVLVNAHGRSNNDVGLDGMVINVASLLAGTVTNPFRNGFFQRLKETPSEVTSA
ncbi:hypothetical protein K1719_017142 [Acacia pycnantha]|nr:hypothetical protein K1719_017142 [Acacia pycnantha]